MILSSEPGEERTARPRGLGFALSAALHAALVAALAVLPAPPPESRTPVFDELIRPHVRQVLIFDARTLPRAAQPETPIGDAPQPAGAVEARRTVIANAPAPKSETQFVWQPAPKLEAPRDVAAPDLVARLARITMPAPPPPKPDPEIPKPELPKPEPVNPDPPAPEPPKPETARPEKRAPKLFEPPKPPAARPKLPVETSLADPPPPGGGAPRVGFSPIAPQAPAAPGPPSPGNANADLAVVSARPTDGSEAPAGERAGRFSRAPNAGAPASGKPPDPSAPVVPNLASSGPPGIAPSVKPAVPRQDPLEGRPVLYQERIKAAGAATLSVPLRPAARSVPRSVEARFRGRTVYAVVIPFENFPDYAGDWILWFAEKDPRAGDTPVIRAPVPVRKIEAAAAAQALRPERAQVTGILGIDGRLRDLRVLTLAAAPRSGEIIRDLEAWDFRPVTRNGQPVETEVVLEIVFNLAASAPVPTQP